LACSLCVNKWANRCGHLHCLPAECWPGKMNGMKCDFADTFICPGGFTFDAPFIFCILGGWHSVPEKFICSTGIKWRRIKCKMDDGVLGNRIWDTILHCSSLLEFHASAKQTKNKNNSACCAKNPIWILQNRLWRSGSQKSKSLIMGSSNFRKPVKMMGAFLVLFYLVLN